MPVKNKLSELRFGKYIKYTIFATNIIAIILLLLSLLSWTIVPSKIIIFSYLGLIFPITLCVNIAYLLLWLITWRWRYALIQFVVLLLCGEPISASFAIKIGEKDIPEKHYKILSYNVRGFNWLMGSKARQNPIFDYLKSSDADIICLQEFVVTPEYRRDGIISEKEFNEIMKDYPYHSIIRFDKTNWGKYMYGIAVYSKFPITQSVKLPIKSLYNGSVIHTLDMDGKKVSLVVNHLESNRLTSEDKKLYKDFLKARDKESFDEMANSLQEKLSVAYTTRESQVNIIRRFMDEQESDATIVCGDFNDTPLSYTYHTLKGDLVDAYTNTGLGWGVTYHENYFLVRIDYILHSFNMDSYKFTIDKVKYSDHYPVWAYLSFK
ncbi:endonuclease/exonuclease/phosphatase family protein [Dysgonomonas sp. 511]|uniref:endonuclease/exonuclease/phosphatase family protein n=1 Tax=Dysgonomonas sp. 511 TaxID=2302930 RepID=UPI0013D7A3E0|nr:endonuclease/exonuclease/phosphatase family protein [Dysgonomonas sp. 511]NDV77921.1 hypothetical protein [Dysgonomonas sp. 511]